MSRRLECRSCFQKGKMLTVDEMLAGWRCRLVPVAVDITHRDVLCDNCNDDIHGAIAFAISQWQGEGNYMLPWEHEFGRVLTDDEFRLADKLSDIHPMVTEDCVYLFHRHESYNYER